MLPYIVSFQLLDGDFKDQLLHESDGLIFQPAGKADVRTEELLLLLALTRSINWSSLIAVYCISAAA